MTVIKTPLAVIEACYAAFGRGDIATVLGHVADPVDWRFVAPSSVPYTGRRSNPAEVGRWFEEVAAVDDFETFEPHEFIVGGDKVTVIGSERCKDRNTGRAYETEWVHVFTVTDGKVTRFWGMYDTAASDRARMAG